MIRIYSRPKLKNLSVGSRIAFVRHLRRMTREELALKIGLSDRNAKRIMSRYERSLKTPKPDKLRKIAEVLEINVRMIWPYDFNDPSDLFYLMLWIEELCPDIKLKKPHYELSNETQRFLAEHMGEWRKMRRRYLKNEIRYEEYWEWKFNLI